LLLSNAVPIDDIRVREWMNATVLPVVRYLGARWQRESKTGIYE
jgi:hypothetical protein